MGRGPENRYFSFFPASPGEAWVEVGSIIYRWVLLQTTQMKMNENDNGCDTPQAVGRVYIPKNGSPLP